MPRTIVKVIQGPLRTHGFGTAGVQGTGTSHPSPPAAALFQPSHPLRWAQMYTVPGAGDILYGVCMNSRGDPHAKAQRNRWQQQLEEYENLNDALAKVKASRLEYEAMRRKQQMRGGHQETRHPKPFVYEDSQPRKQVEEVKSIGELSARFVIKITTSKEKQDFLPHVQNLFSVYTRRRVPYKKVSDALLELSDVLYASVVFTQVTEHVFTPHSSSMGKPAIATTMAKALNLVLQKFGDYLHKANNQEWNNTGVEIGANASLIRFIHDDLVILQHVLKENAPGLNQGFVRYTISVLDSMVAHMVQRCTLQYLTIKDVEYSIHAFAKRLKACETKDYIDQLGFTRFKLKLWPFDILHDALKQAQLSISDSAHAKPSTSQYSRLSSSHKASIVPAELPMQYRHSSNANGSEPGIDNPISSRRTSARRKPPPVSTEPNTAPAAPSPPPRTLAWPPLTAKPKHQVSTTSAASTHSPTSPTSSIDSDLPHGHTLRNPPDGIAMLTAPGAQAHTHATTIRERRELPIAKKKRDQNGRSKQIRKRAPKARPVPTSAGVAQSKRKRAKPNAKPKQ